MVDDELSTKALEGLIFLFQTNNPSTLYTQKLSALSEMSKTKNMKQYPQLNQAICP